MCLEALTGGRGKFLDPGGWIAEKTTPKAFAPYSGLHGTANAMYPEEKPVRPYDPNFFSSAPLGGAPGEKAAPMGSVFGADYNADALAPSNKQQAKVIK